MRVHTAVVWRIARRHHLARSPCAKRVGLCGFAGSRVLRLGHKTRKVRRGGPGRRKLRRSRDCYRSHSMRAQRWRGSEVSSPREEVTAQRSAANASAKQPNSSATLRVWFVEAPRWGLEDCPRRCGCREESNERWVGRRSVSAAAEMGRPSLQSVTVAVAVAEGVVATQMSGARFQAGMAVVSRGGAGAGAIAIWGRAV